MLHILHIVHILHIFHVFILDLILFRILVAGFELSSDEDDVPLHPDLQAQTHDVLHDMPSPVLPPLPPAQRPFEFSSFIRRSGGDTTSLLSAIRETDAHLPPGPIIVYSERAGGAVRCFTLDICTCILCQSYELCS